MFGFRTRAAVHEAELCRAERRVQSAGQSDRGACRRQERRRRLRGGRAASAGRRADRHAVGRLESRRGVPAGGRDRAVPSGPTRDRRGQALSGDHQHTRR